MAIALSRNCDFIVTDNENAPTMTQPIVLPRPRDQYQPLRGNGRRGQRHTRASDFCATTHAHAEISRLTHWRAGWPSRRRAGGRILGLRAVDRCDPARLATEALAKGNTERACVLEIHGSNTHKRPADASQRRGEVDPQPSNATDRFRAVTSRRIRAARAT